MARENNGEAIFEFESIRDTGDVCCPVCWVVRRGVRVMVGAGGGLTLAAR